MALRTGFSWLILFLTLALNGCLPAGISQSDDEKEPHFVLGKSRVNSMDYQGAVNAFEESLEANPHSAAAHFELGWLYDEKIPDPAAAIFHYKQYLKFSPHAENADVIRLRIDRCKQQLAADVLPLPSAPAAQQQLQQLMDKNRQLEDELAKWRAYYTAQQAAQKTNAPDNSTPAAQSPSESQRQNVVQPERVINPQSAPAVSRTHTVIAGETPSSIARKHGVKLEALMAANPGLNPRKMRVGEILKIPAP